MKKVSVNHTKKICKLYYQDKIWQLRSEGKTVQEITDYINFSCIPRSQFKNITLSKTTIFNIIKKKDAKK